MREEKMCSKKCGMNQCESTSNLKTVRFLSKMTHHFLLKM